jgi:hypothetical protein
MTDSKTSLAAAEAAIQEAGSAFDAERATLVSALDQASSDLDALSAKVADQTSTIADLQAQIAALQPKPVDPWAAIDKTGKIEVGALLQQRVDAGDNIPGGTYLVDPTKPVLFKKGCIGEVNPDGTPAVYLVAKPSATPRDCIYEVVGAGIVVKNIHSVGDRISGAYTPGSTNEWGYGCKVSGAGSTVENCYSSLCTGDGFGITGPNITVKNCVSDRNRRQGLSGFNCSGLKIIGGAFTNTGTVTVDGKTDPGAPNGPWAGIDIEPDKLASGVPNVDVSITGARIAGNKGSGVLGYLRPEVGGNLTMSVTDCLIDGNADGVRGEAVIGGVPGKVSMTVNRNALSRHKGAAVRANDGTTINVGSANLADANTIIGATGPTTRSFTKAGIVTPYDLRAYGTGVINAGLNHYD